MQLAGLRARRGLNTRQFVRSPASTAHRRASSCAGRTIPKDARATAQTATITDQPQLKDLLDELLTQDHGLVMTMGKGSVGKTTVASALAVGLAQASKKVLLTTTDPAYGSHTCPG